MTFSITINELLVGVCLFFLGANFGLAVCWLIVRYQAKQITQQKLNDKISGNGHLPKGLTSRQHRVLELLSEGLSNKEIGRRLSIGEPTVKLHMRHVLRKLSVTNRTQAALWMQQSTGNGGILVHPDSDRPGTGGSTVHSGDPL